MIFNRTPQKYSAANSPVVFSMSGNADTVFFKTELVEASTLSTVFTGNLFPTPINPSQASINLSNQLNSLVRSDIDNADTLFVGKRKPLIGYKLKATEYILSSGGTLVAGTSATTSTYYSLEASPDIFNYTNRFTGDTYVTKANNTSKFLTLQPNFKPVNDYSFEQLYFLVEGYSALTATYVVGGNTFNKSYTASTGNTEILTPAYPEQRAKATIIVTATTSHDNDNIVIKVNGSNLGQPYSAFTTAFTQTQLATNIMVAGAYNSSGYTLTSTGNTVEILAPVGLGSAGNSLSITTQLNSTGTTSVIITAETKATAIITGYPEPPTIDDETVVYVTEPSGYFNLYAGIVSYAGGLTDYTTALVSLLNANPYGYIITKTGVNTFVITARPGLGATQNTQSGVLYNGSVDPSFYSGTFSGGVTSGTGGETTTYSIIPHILIPFSGGSDPVAATSGFSFDKLVRLQTSPKKLTANGITGFTHGQTYSVVLNNSTGGTITEVKQYLYEDSSCNSEYVNVCFTNSLGGIDSVQLVSPQSTLSTTKASIKKNNINMNSDNVYLTNGVYNPSDEVYKTTSKYNFKAYTKMLKDIDADWLTELVNSKNIYVELTDGNLVPVQLVNTNYNIQKARYQKDVNQYQFEFSFSDGYIPALAKAGIIINQ